MQSLIENVKPEYIVNKKENKKAVILSLREYESIIEWIEDIENANDLLRAEREADSFVPYDNGPELTTIRSEALFQPSATGLRSSA